MTIARDASSPARFSISNNAGGGESGTSASFTPPNNSWLYLSVCANSQVSATPTFNLPTNTGTGVGTWVLVKSQTNASGGAVAVYRAPVTTGSATTVSISITNCGSNTSGIDAAAWVDVWTGAATTQTGAATAGNTSTTQNISPTVTTTASGSQVAGVAIDWAEKGVPTSTDTINGYDIATQTSGGRAYKAANSGAAGSVTLNFDAAATGPQWTYALYEILAPASTASEVAEYVTTDVRPDDRAAGLIQRSASGGALPRVCAFVAAAPLFMDLTGSAAHFSTAPGIQGRSVCAQVIAAPQDLPSRAAQIQKSVSAAVLTSGKLGAYLTTVVQPDDRPTNAVFPAVKAGFTPGVLSYWDAVAQPPWDISQALTFRSAAAPIGPALAAQYTFGAHAAVLITAEAQKTQQWSSVRTPALTAPLGQYVVSGPAPFDPNPQQPWDPNAPAKGGSPPQIGMFSIAAPTGDPNVPAPFDPFASARATAAPTGPVLMAQWANPAPLDVIAAVTARAQIGPQGPTVRAFVAAPTGDPTVPAAQTVAAAPASHFGPVPPFQSAAPAPLDAIQGWIETPTFNAQGYLIAFQEGVPGDLWALAPQSFAATTAAVIPPAPLRMQWAAPATLDVITAVTVRAQTGAQGPTVRAYLGAPPDPAPLGFAASFTIQRVGSVPGVGPVPAFVATTASPVDPAPSAAQKFASAAGGVLPRVSTYQAAGAGSLLDAPQPAWSRVAIGPPLAFAYQTAGPRLTPDTIGPVWSAPLVGPTLAFTYQFAAPQPLDALAAQIVAARIAPISAVVPAYIIAVAQQIDLTVQPAISRAAASIPAATIRPFAAAPAFTDVVGPGAAWWTYRTAGFLARPSIPTIRFALADYPQRTVLTEYAIRIS